MGYLLTGIEDVRIIAEDGGIVLRARNTNADKIVQCYVSGELYAWQTAPAEFVEFVLPPLSATSSIFLLAVDVGEEATDYFDAAYPVSDDYGNRLSLAVPRTIAPYGPADVIEFARGDAGDGSAGILMSREPFYPGGRRCGGFGFHFGYGGFGWDGADCRGFGYNFGLGEFGFDCEMIALESEALPPGVYPYSVVVTDPAGNESTAAEGTITLDTYARPASGLSVESFSFGDSELALSFTASEDI